MCVGASTPSMTLVVASTDDVSLDMRKRCSAVNSMTPSTVIPLKESDYMMFTPKTSWTTSTRKGP